MELSYNELRKKEVVNTIDGKKLGRICDLVFCYPENKILGFVVPGIRGFGLKREEYFIDVNHIVKIGEDVILVKVGLKAGAGTCCPPPPNRNEGNGNKGKDRPPEPRRIFEEYE